jgi:hypothetical protein
VVEQDWPFTFADSPRLHALCSVTGDGQGLGQYADLIARRVGEMIRPRIQCCRELVLVLDEFPEARGMPSLGLKVHGLYLAEGMLHYRA